MAAPRYWSGSRFIRQARVTVSIRATAHENPGISQKTGATQVAFHLPGNSYLPDTVVPVTEASFKPKF
jgi:hypothetical protein